jgi:hypothetical protein
VFFGDLTLRLRAWLLSISGPFGGHATLADNLLSYWNLDEVSGVRYDSVVASANDLTDINTVGSATGINNLAASFVEASSEYFTRDAFTGPPDDFTISLWHKVDTTLAINPRIFVSEPSANLERFSIRWINGARVYRCTVSSGIVATIDSASVAAGTNWHQVVLAYDSSTRKMTVYVDNGTGILSTALAAARLNTVARLYVGSDNIFGYHTGLMDEAGIWSRVLTAQERTDLWASGAGLFY